MKALSDISILTIGEVCLDQYVYGTTNRVAAEAPIPVIHKTGEEVFLGMSGNVATNLSSLGVKTTLLTCVGMDQQASEIRRLCAKHGVQLIDVLTPGRPTINKQRIVAAGRVISRVDTELTKNLGSDTEAWVENEFRVALGQCDAVVLQDYGKGMLTNPRWFIEQANKAGKLVFVDPSGTKELDAYVGAHLLKANTKEAAGNTAQEISNYLMSPYAVVTRAEAGMEGYQTTPETFVDVPGEAVVAVDPSGCGDSVIAVLAAFMTAGRDFKEALVAANKAGSFVATKLGTAIVSLSDLQ